MDQQLQKLVRQLGDAINATLSDSDRIAEVISQIRTSGYDVFLVLEATIAFNAREEAPAPRSRAPRNPEREPELKISTQDMKFLKSLRISIKRDKAA